MPMQRRTFVLLSKQIQGMEVVQRTDFAELWVFQRRLEEHKKDRHELKTHKHMLIGSPTRSFCLGAITQLLSLTHRFSKQSALVSKAIFCNNLSEKKAPSNLYFDQTDYQGVL